MIHDLPTLGRSPPDGRPLSDAGALNQLISEKIVIASELEAMKVAGLPGVFRFSRVPFLQLIQNMLSTVALTRGADFPKCRFGHLFEISARGSELRTMEDGFPLFQFVEHI